MKEFVLINAKIVKPQGIFEGFVVVKDGKIEKIGKGEWDAKKEGGKLAEGFETIDVKGKHLLPGLIDVHVHFRTPGMTEKEDWTSGSKAALAGGVTTVFDMPNTVPPTTDQEGLDLKRSIVSEKALVNYGFFGGATKTNLENLANMNNLVGIKVYMGSSTGNLLVDDVKTLEALMQSAGEDVKKGAAGGSGKFHAHEEHRSTIHGKILAIHAENEVCIQHGFEEHKGEDDPAVHSKIRAPECAEQAVKLVLELVKKYRAKVHICHASTRAEIDFVRKFKKHHPKEIADLVSVEVTPHHLFMDDSEYAKQGNVVKVNPPLRSHDDVLALWEGIADGTVTMVATDHAPHLMAEKQLSYAQVPSGVPGVQTMLPLLLNAVHEGKLTLEKVVELCSANPAERFGLEEKGKIENGADADFTVVDMELHERVCHHFLWTKPHWSPFHNWWLVGWPVMTFVNGEKMFEWRDTFGKSLGREI